MRRTPKKNKRRQPDETFQAGPLAFARYGKLIVSKNLASQEEMRDMHEQMAASYDSVVSRIDEATIAIGNIVARYDPLDLLKRAYWLDTVKLIRIESEVEMGTEHALALRMLDYVQAVVVSYPPDRAGYRHPTDDVWNDLSARVKELFDLINHSYPFAAWARKKLENSNIDQDHEDFIFKAQLYWVNIRGDRYVNHDVAHLTDVLSPHDDIFRDLFGVSVADIIHSYEKLQNSLLRGPFESIRKLKEIQKQAWPQVEQQLKGGESDDDIRTMVKAEIVKLGLQEKIQISLEQAFGLGLFDVGKVTGLPAPLLAELSYKPGEEKSFFAEGPHRGWPLKVWPNWVRPFLMVDGSAYCFDLYSMKDRLYRVLQRLICRVRPEYQETWNARQKAVSEWLPFKIFGRLLPGGSIHQSLYYRFRPEDEAEAKWYESDGVFIYDDVLIAIEVKGGAFTLAPPSSNFESYVSSLNELVARPAKQSSRFLQYLGSAQEVPLFDKDHKEILRLRATDYKVRIGCAVTLDAFTELAARAGHLKAIGVDIGREPIWNISIDDLRVYADLFDDPLRFLHFVEQRIKAVQASSVDLEDEIDHLGLYLKHNHYVKVASDMSKNGSRPMHWHGYRQDVDRYYHRIMAEPDRAVLPMQALPKRLQEVLNVLNKQNKPSRSWLANRLLDMDAETRTGICDSIEVSIAEQIKTGRVKPMSMHGEMKLTMFCWQPYLFPQDKTLAQEHSRVVMLVNDESERLLLELTLKEGGAISEVSWNQIGLTGLSGSYIAELREKAMAMREARVKKELSRQKIGVNDPCPCGSGRKFKRCCGRR